MTIETNQYIATAGDVEKLALSILSADQQSLGGMGTYLKALVATTQAELGSPPRMRNVRTDRLSDEEATAHLKGFEAVAKRFYDAVMKAAEPLYTDSEERRSRTGKFRSAGSTVRGFIRANNDVRALAAHKVTKAALATPRSKRKFSVDALKKRALSTTEQLVGIVKNLSAANSAEAKEAVQLIMAQLAQTAGMTQKTGTDVDKAIEAGEAFHTKTGIFLPINLSAVREQRRAAA